MTEPTQAQIEYEKAYANLGGVGFACFLTHAEQEAAFKEAFERLAVASQPYVLELKAALTAAAQMEKRTWDNGEPLNLAAAQVGDTAIAVWMGRRGYATGHGDTTEEILDELHSQAIAATIERCAQVAENELFTGDAGRDIAAAIRALKDQP